MYKPIFKFNIHSVVDVITNSSTTIYTYQSGCKQPAKELINEMLKLSGVVDKTADDLFYFGVFCDLYRYIEYVNRNLQNLQNLQIEGYPLITVSYKEEEYKEQREAQTKWMNDLHLSIMKGEIEEPDWFDEVERNDDGYNPDSYLCMVPRDEKYTEFGIKISKLLNSIDADGGYDG